MNKDNIRKEILGLVKRGKYDAAVSECDRFLASFPGEAELFRCRSHAYAQSGKLDRAVQDLTRAIRLEPDEPHDYFSLGRYELIRGAYQRAIENFTKVLELCRKFKSDYYKEMAYFHRAETYLRQKRFDLSLKDIRKVRDSVFVYIDMPRSKEEIYREAIIGKTKAKN